MFRVHTSKGTSNRSGDVEVCCHSARSHSHEKRLSGESCPSICPSVRMYQRGSHLIDVCEISYQWLLWKSVGKIQICLKSDKKKGYVTWWRKCFSQCWQRHAERSNRHRALFFMARLLIFITLLTATPVRQQNKGNIFFLSHDNNV